jgi:hypothetical protein
MKILYLSEYGVSSRRVQLPVFERPRTARRLDSFYRKAFES